MSSFRIQRLFPVLVAIPFVMFQPVEVAVAGPRPTLNSPRIGYERPVYYWPQFRADQRSFQFYGSSSGYNCPDVFRWNNDSRLGSTGFPGSNYRYQANRGSQVRSNLPAGQRNAYSRDYGRSSRYDHRERIITYSEYLARRQGNRGVTVKAGR
ncbi:MAG: hypothetical protein V1794_01390 [Candidatus Glassbacteria bacterium]